MCGPPMFPSRGADRDRALAAGEIEIVGRAAVTEPDVAGLESRKRTRESSAKSSAIVVESRARTVRLGLEDGP